METETAVTPAVSRRATGEQGWEDLVLGEGTASPGLSRAGETYGEAHLERGASVLTLLCPVLGPALSRTLC